MTLVQYGPLTVTGACVADMTGPRAEVRVQSTEAGSSADGEEASFGNLGDRRSGRGRRDLHGPARDRVLTDRRVRRGTAALSGVVSLIADGAGAGACRFQGHAVVSGVPTPIP